MKRIDLCSCWLELWGKVANWFGRNNFIRWIVDNFREGLRDTLFNLCSSFSAASSSQAFALFSPSCSTVTMGRGLSMWWWGWGTFVWWGSRSKFRVHKELAVMVGFKLHAKAGVDSTSWTQSIMNRTHELSFSFNSELVYIASKILCQPFYRLALKTRFIVSFFLWPHWLAFNFHHFRSCRFCKKSDYCYNPEEFFFIFTLNILYWL